MTDGSAAEKAIPSLHLESFGLELMARIIRFALYSDCILDFVARESRTVRTDGCQRRKKKCVGFPEQKYISEAGMKGR